MKSISVADSFVVRVSGEENSSSLANIIEELHYDVVDDSVKLPTVGNIMYDSYLSFPLGAIELRKGILYEYNDYLIIYDKNNLLRIHADKTQFEILVSDRANKQILFYTVEILIRYYAPLYGLTFLHAGGFIMDGKTNVICAFGGVGKTEVTLYALEKGAKFLADDFAIINSNGDVFPYMKKIFLCDFPYKPEKWLEEL